MITIIDYHVGNCSSIKNMLKKAGHKSIITDSSSVIDKATKVIIPGVGSFDKGIQKIKELEIYDSINNKVLNEKVPTLGICLGMQLLLNSSEEGEEEGFGWINGSSRKFVFDDNSLRVPHMGWNYVELEREHRVLSNCTNRNKFYFVHSFYVELENPEDTLMTTEYGGRFTSAVNKDNIYGFQFHPEKSHKYGLNLLNNFANL